MTVQPEPEPLQAPFPWFGGKRKVADQIWDRLGDVQNYVEPFAGSLAVLLRRPHAPRVETVNDMNAWLANFWRAVARDPDAVAHWADYPVSELDLHARGDWLFYGPGVAIVERLREDPDFYDPKVAGWWVWGQSSWIGDCWGPSGNGKTKRSRPHLWRGAGVNAARVSGVERKRPHLAHNGKGVNAGRVARQIPHLAHNGKGVNAGRVARQIPHLSSEQGERTCEGIAETMRALAERLRRVRIVCGDWARVTGPSVTWCHGTTGVFLDPPYGVADRDTVYHHDSLTVAAEVREWAIREGTNPAMRICYAGYVEECGDLAAAGWSAVAWKTQGGYGNQRAGGNDNGARERLYFSPHCLPPAQPDMFGGAA